METTITNRQNKRFKRKLVFIILLSLCGVWLLPQQAAALDGIGSSTNPFLIKNTTDWASFKNGNYDSGVFWKLDADLSLSGDYIGVSSKPFTGTFDGNEKTITLTSTFGASDREHVALFSYTNNATIKNLNLAFSSTSVGDYSGGLIAEATGTLSIDNIHIKNASTNDKIGVSGSFWGGLIGTLNNTTGANVRVSSCSVVLNVDLSGSSKNSVGGLIGNKMGGGTLEVKDCLAAITFSGSTVSHSSIGGLIGSIDNQSGTTTLIRCFVGGPVPKETDTQSMNGRYIGVLRKYATLNTYSLRTIAVSGGHIREIGLHDGGHNPLDHSYSQSWSADQTFDLDRRTDLAAVIPITEAGNERWGFDSSSRPKVSKTGYAVKIVPGTNIASMSGFYTRDYGSAACNVNADKCLTVYPSSSLSITEHQRPKYSFVPDYLPRSGSPTHVAELSGNNWLLYAKVNGTVNVDGLVNIPYPVTLSGDFNQWQGKVDLSWTASNPDKLSGGWYVYRKLNTGASSTYVKISDELSIATRNYSASVTSDDFGKQWDYAVCFVEDGSTLPSDPTTSNNHTVTRVSTNASITISSFTATGGDTFINLEFKVPSQLNNSTSYKYSIERKVLGGSYTNVVANQSFEGKQFYIYKDDLGANPCVKYQYRLTITAFGKTFTAETDPVGVSTTGSNKLIKIKASKGEYSAVQNKH